MAIFPKPFANDILDASANSKTFIRAADYHAHRTLLGLGTAALANTGDFDAAGAATTAAGVAQAFAIQRGNHTGTQSANSISGGTLSDTVLSSNVVLKNAANAFSVGGHSIATATGATGLTINHAVSPNASTIGFDIKNSAGFSVLKYSYGFGTSNNAWGLTLDGAGAGNIFTIFSITNDLICSSNVNCAGLFVNSMSQATIRSMGMFLGPQGLGFKFGTTPPAYCLDMHSIPTGQKPVNLNFYNNSSTTLRQMGAVVSEYVDITDATRKGRLKLDVLSVSTIQTGLQIDADTSAPKIGFLGATPVLRQVVPGSGSVTAADLRTALINLGLCV